VTISRFRSALQVGIREFYYDKDGQLKHTQKGLNLSVEQWKNFLAQLGDINAAIREAGEDVDEPAPAQPGGSRVKSKDIDDDDEDLPKAESGDEVPKETPVESEIDVKVEVKD
jgi:hypothetical protein